MHKQLESKFCQIIQQATKIVAYSIPKLNKQTKLVRKSKAPPHFSLNDDIIQLVHSLQNQPQAH